jgi:hypothetical protein
VVSFTVIHLASEHIIHHAHIAILLLLTLLCTFLPTSHIRPQHTLPAPHLHAMHKHHDDSSPSELDPTTSVTQRRIH